MHQLGEMRTREKNMLLLFFRNNAMTDRALDKENLGHRLLVLLLSKAVVVKVVVKQMGERKIKRLQSLQAWTKTIYIRKR